MTKKQKLELTWVGKENRPRLEPRILIEDPARSYHAAVRVSDSDIFDNMLIHGDNLLALKALEADYAGKVKCVYIDPPFNTQQAFEHYDDGIEHSLWLGLIRDRLEILRNLLAKDGTLFVHIDENELGYLIVILDEIMGRKNRISVVTFTQSSASGPKSINPGIVTTNNYLLYYAKDKNFWRPNKVFTPTVRDDCYSKYISGFEKGYENWILVGLKEAFASHEGLSDWKEAQRKFHVKLEEKLTDFVLQNCDRVVSTARVAPKDVNEDAREALEKSNRNPGIVFSSARSGKDDYYFLNGRQLIFYKNKTKFIDGKITTAVPLTNLWDDISSNSLHTEGVVDFPKGKKPEALIKRCLELSTKEGELVLDSFAGSGTTGAVAHKMHRRWIMTELREQAWTHIVPRLHAVIDGTDTSGVSKAVNWHGGGGFRYYELAPSLLETDKWGRKIISPDYDAAMLARAICKLEGFTYEPSDSVYWQQGHSSERDFLYVTTQTLGPEELAALSEDVGEGRSLIILCNAFRGNADLWPNLTLRKIPNHIRSKCEWGHDDYSLNVANLPMAEKEPAPRPPAQLTLFDGEGTA
ncbi:MAG: site-specific DNA-methyltransferase [Rhodobacteraceae bacterium]|nr:site-specific DNA-methyltransferase [Paracoccaceae bacterium]